MAPIYGMTTFSEHRKEEEFKRPSVKPRCLELLNKIAVRVIKVLLYFTQHLASRTIS